MKLSLATLLLIGTSSALSIKQSFVWDEKEALDLEKSHADAEIEDKKNEVVKQKQIQLVEQIKQEIATPIEPFEKKKKPSFASVPLKNISNQQYTGEIFFGSPPQKITVQFDTGSAIVYVLTNQCSEDCNKETKYNLAQSVSEDDPQRMEYGYGSGYISGFTDRMKVGFAQDDSQPFIPSVNILVADQATGVEKDRFAGIIGLSPKSSELKLPAFLQQLHEEQVFGEVKLDSQAPLQPLVSFYLSKTPKEKGMVTFGGYDVSLYAKPGKTEKDVFWADTVKGEKYWTLNMGDVSLGTKEVDQIKSRYVIMDTGVSYALIPAVDFVTLTNNLAQNYGVKCAPPKGEGNLVNTYQCTCDSYASLPTIHIQIAADSSGKSTNTFSVPKESYMEKHDDKCRTLRLIPNGENFGNDKLQSYWVMGDIFLQNYYSIYDFAQQKVGLVESKGEQTGEGWG